MPGAGECELSDTRPSNETQTPLVMVISGRLASNLVARFGLKLLELSLVFDHLDVRDTDRVPQSDDAKRDEGRNAGGEEAIRQPLDETERTSEQRDQYTETNHLTRHTHTFREPPNTLFGYVYITM